MEEAVMCAYRVISGDGHIEIPAGRLTSYIPQEHQDKVPELVTKSDGTHWWRMDEWERNCVGPLVGELSYEEFVPPLGARYTNFDGSWRPGTGDAVQRLREQDLDGVDAEVLFPPAYMGAFIRLLATKDVEAYKAIVKGFNTFLATEYCSVAPDRLIGNAMVLETGVDDAIEEMRRCKELGLRAVNLRLWPNGGDDFSPEDDRFFAAALEMDMKVAAHGFFGGKAILQQQINVDGQFIFRKGANGGGRVMESIGDMIFHGVFDRHPDLKIYFAETQAGWLPHSLNWSDEYFLRWYSYHDISLDKLPSEYVRDHCRFSFITDRLAMKFRHFIGLDLLMWGSDFPHSVGTFPHSREVIDELFEDVPENERHQVLVENACEFYGLDPKQQLTPTPA